MPQVLGRLVASGVSVEAATAGGEDEHDDSDSETYGRTSHQLRVDKRRLGEKEWRRTATCTSSSTATRGDRARVKSKHFGVHSRGFYHDSMIGMEVKRMRGLARLMARQRARFDLVGHNGALVHTQALGQVVCEQVRERGGERGCLGGQGECGGVLCGTGVRRVRQLGGCTRLVI